jgi:hypothetical protein
MKRTLTLNPTPNAHEGVKVQFDRQAQTITLSGWFDGGVGIPPHTLPLWQFLTELGIGRTDLNSALEEIDVRTRVGERSASE